MIGRAVSMLDPLIAFQMEVDLARRRDLTINMDVFFPAIPCAGKSDMHVRAAISFVGVELQSACLAHSRKPLSEYLPINP